MISWKFIGNNQLPIGLDIGHHYVKMIQLANNNGHMSVVAADKFRIDPHINGDVQERRNFIVSAIKQMLARSDFSKTKVVSCLSNDELKITSLRLSESEGESMEQSALGVVGGGLSQFTTTDSFEDVVKFYADALKQYETQSISHESELGRQTVLSIPQENGMTSVAIQEFVEEGTVNITFMGVGS